MIEFTEETDFNLKFIENISTTASEYMDNLRKEKETLQQLKLEIFNSINSVISSINTEITIYESKSELFNEVLNKKKAILKEKDKIKMNYSQNISEEAKIFKFTTEEYLSLIYQIENTKVYLNDILSNVTSQAPNQFNLLSQEPIGRISNIPIDFSQLDRFSQENINKLYSQRLQEISEKKESENEEVRKNMEAQCSNSVVPYHMSKEYQDAIIKANLPPVIIRNKTLSKEIRKKFLEGNHEDFLFNPKYEEIWKSIPDNIYRGFAREMKKFGQERKYKGFNISPYSIEKTLRTFIRVKYTAVNSVDYISPKGGIFTEKIRGALIKSWIKLKFVVSTDNPSNLNKRLTRLKSMFIYYFFKKSDKNTYKFYGQIRSYFRFDNHFFWKEAFKNKYEYLSWKSYQHEEDLMKNFKYDAGFKHNLEDSFIEDLHRRARELDEIRKEYARIVLNYIVI